MRRHGVGEQYPETVISIHAPRVGCDGQQGPCRPGAQNFNPRTPCGVRQDYTKNTDIDAPISIHAPRVGCDGRGLISPHRPLHFNPRTPCGVRLAHKIDLPCAINFNPRTPCGVRRGRVLLNLCTKRFQSTHPVWGATSCVHLSTHNSSNFNPRTPCGVRQAVPK